MKVLKAINADEFSNDMTCIHYQILFRIAKVIQEKEIFNYYISDRNLKSMKLLIYFWLLFRYSRLLDLEFTEKLIMMEERFEQITKMRINEICIFQDIKTKINRIYYDEEIQDADAEEFEIIGNQNTWLIEGEETTT
ncbi:MAG: hypothetical protein Ta2E_13170 [Mycoplasmoidaceae bacterium]|nr:MAG: hypothetical protein Ta2E_13170 [Mycoplasmoidaceae bacterium]